MIQSGCGASAPKIHFSMPLKRPYSGLYSACFHSSAAATGHDEERHDHQGADDAAAEELAVEQQGDAQAEHEADPDDADGEQDGDDDGVAGVRRR